MSIIEKIIAEKEQILIDCENKLQESAELKAKAEQLENEALAVDTITIENEIAELKEYLPKCEVQVENIPENPIE